ncbi:MAG: tRNA pseudouridine(55) synthase, partial [Chitinophagales bacterium]|nr:tRNA pseudouridine(55) synthase [Chitinophagales bacterium]
PVYSAIKKNGRIAYKEARSGREMKLEERPIKIHYFHITNIEMPYVSFEIKCSKGTYIRSVAHDFGKILGCGACLAELRRIGVGKFSVEDAFPPEQALEKILKEL